jgi:hypothetical protein
VYKKGTENRVADALWRIHEPHQFHMISSITSQWLASVQNSYQSNPQAIELISKLSLQANVVPHFTLKDGLLRDKSRIWIGQDPALHSQLVVALHNSIVGGHSSSPVTYRWLKHVFAWKGMKSEVQNYVQTCQVCLQAKPDRAAYPGKLQPLPIPVEAWHIVSMDFIEGLPKSRSASCMFVIVDKFTRYGHFIALSHPFTASSVALAFMNEVYTLHGMPVAIISYRDPIFTSKF